VVFVAGPRAILAGFKLHVSERTLTVDGKVTVPVNPLSGVTVSVKVAWAFPRTVTLLGARGVTAKSWTVTLNVVELLSPPLVPTTVAT